MQAAQNSSVTLGSGAGALTVQNSTNTLNNLINGVTIQLQKADPTTNLAITVANDTTTPATAINAFVSAYNSLQSEISADTAYDASSSTGGILLGDSRATGIQNQLAGIVGNIVPGVNQAANRLAVLGITFDQNGQLQVDSSTLQSALSGGVQGVSLGDINNLFGLSGQSTNSAIQFVSASSSTNASSPVTVHVTQAATQASVTSSNVVASQVTIDSSDDKFSLTLDGKASTVTLAHGVYSQSQLATTLQTAVNSDTDFNGRSLSVGVLNNQLTFTSATYGSQSQVTIGSADSNAALGLNGNESSTGIDVQGLVRRQRRHRNGEGKRSVPAGRDRQHEHRRPAGPGQPDAGSDRRGQQLQRRDDLAGDRNAARQLDHEHSRPGERSAHGHPERLHRPDHRSRRAQSRRNDADERPDGAPSG